MIYATVRIHISFFKLAYYVSLKVILKTESFGVYLAVCLEKF